ncbi:MAG: hypothetical protein JWR40_3286, partial [Massilia sp.]|nr:hypothetical protein [Massilia sp.]
SQTNTDFAEISISGKYAAVDFR